MIPKLNRRSSQTLVTWYRTLNEWGWPKVFGEPEDTNDAERPRRNEAMTAIQMELGRRTIDDMYPWAVPKKKTKRA